MSGILTRLTPRLLTVQWAEDSRLNRHLNQAQSRSVRLAVDQASRGRRTTRRTPITRRIQGRMRPRHSSSPEHAMATPWREQSSLYMDGGAGIAVSVDGQDIVYMYAERSRRIRGGPSVRAGRGRTNERMVVGQDSGWPSTHIEFVNGGDGDRMGE